MWEYIWWEESNTSIILTATGRTRYLSSPNRHTSNFSCMDQGVLWEENNLSKCLKLPFDAVRLSVVRVPIYIEDHERKPDTFGPVSGGAKVLKSLKIMENIWQYTYFNNSEQCFFICPHDRESFLTTSFEHTFNTSNTHAIYNIPCQPKWNLQVEPKKSVLQRKNWQLIFTEVQEHRMYPLRCFKHETLFKCNTKINVYNLSCILVDENIHGMAIPKTDDIPYLNPWKTIDNIQLVSVVCVAPDNDSSRT